MKEAFYLEAAAATNDQQENKPEHYRMIRLFTTIVRKVTVAAPQLLTADCDDEGEVEA